MTATRRLTDAVRVVGALCMCHGACVATQSRATTGAAQAVELLRRTAPDVKWGAVLEVDLDGDALPDSAVLGRSDTEAVVGFVLQAKPDTPFLFRLRRDLNSQSGICADPTEVRIALERRPTGDDADAPLSAHQPKTTDRQVLQGVGLIAGDCDAFHFYFDGQAVTWWRR